jgi:hypothetical protein
VRLVKINDSRPLLFPERLFAPTPAASLTATPVCGWVNDMRHEGPHCLDAPVVVTGEEAGLFAS